MRKKKNSERVVEFILTRKIEDLKDLTVGKVAKSIGVNRFYLSLKFIIDQKITLPKFILREKMHEAYFILEENKKRSVDELSEELGFSKVEDFNIEFEKYFAIAPKKYRDLREKFRVFRNV